MSLSEFLTKLIVHYGRSGREGVASSGITTAFTITGGKQNH